MNRIFNFILIIFICLSSFVGCSSSNLNNTDTNTIEIAYEQITQAEAKAIMDSEEPYVLLDVRTQEEYDAEHIEGAILIPDYEIETKAESILKDKNALILVYCRSGRRSKNAAIILTTLGYTNIKEFGGIIDWEYDIITK